MARVACTAMFTTLGMSIDWRLLRQVAGDASTPAWREHVASAYRCALAFCLNDFYRREIDVDVLFSRPIDAYAELGTVWTDWVRLRNRRLGTDSLHLHLHFRDIAADLANPACPGIEAIASFMGRIYRLPESAHSADAALLLLGTELRRLTERRHHALGLSRYVFTSLHGLSELPACPVPEGARVNYYRLLFQHARGADAASADLHLGQPWRSTEFFELYAQPGALLAVSTPYPRPIRDEHGEWFDPRPPATPWRDRPRDLLPAPHDYTQYDLLPEYPPLRYLAVPCLEYAAAFEETLRASQDSTFESPLPQFTPRPGPLPVRLLRHAVTLGEWIPRYLAHQLRNRSASALRRHLMAASLEGVRLPIARRFVAALLDDTRQERSLTAVTTWTTRRLAVVAGFIAVLALVATLYFGMQPRQPSPAPPATASR